MDGDGAVEGDGEVELGLEGGDLFFQRSTAEAGEAGIVGAGAVEHPAVEADFADRGPGIGDEVGLKGFEPRGGTIPDVPRVETVGGEESNGLRAESGELRDRGGMGGAKGGDG